MATFVLVPGGAHGGWCYRKVARALRAEGHEVHALTLTGVGERSHLRRAGIGLDTHVQDVVATLVWEDLRDVILVGHSYGGMVITGVADRVPDRIGRIVYLDAAVPRDGQNLVDVAGPMITATREHAQVIDGCELVLLPFPGAGRFYGVTEDADVAWMDERLTGHPWATFADPLTITDPDALSAIPDYHLVCSRPMADRDLELQARLREAGRLWEVDTGHDLMITEPGWVTARLLEVAAHPGGPRCAPVRADGAPGA